MKLRLNSRCRIETLSGHCRAAFVAAAAAMFSGCILKTATVPTRHFVLTPVPATEPSTRSAGDVVSVEIGLVRMAQYLLRDRLTVRNGDNEIEYFENALWAERLDQGIQRVLALNLSRSLATNSADHSKREPAIVRVFIYIQQFDVDTKGRGTLIAHWRINSLDANKPLKSGDTQISKSGASPHNNPQIIAIGLSNLLADFTGELTRAILASVGSTNN